MSEQQAPELTPAERVNIERRLRDDEGRVRLWRHALGLPPAASQVERPDEANSRGLSRAKGLAEALAQARSYPVDMDGVRGVAAEIVTLLDGAARLPDAKLLDILEAERDRAEDRYERESTEWREERESMLAALARLPERPDEDPMPVFTIQGKDLLAAPVITYYQRQVEGLLDGGQAHEVELARQEIEAWQKRNPDRCKYPDHRHVPVEADR